MNIAQIKDEIRYMSRSEKLEMYKWLDGELAGDLPSRLGSNRSNPVRQEIEWTWKVDGKNGQHN